MCYLFVSSRNWHLSIPRVGPYTLTTSHFNREAYVCKYVLRIIFALFSNDLFVVDFNEDHQIGYF